MKRNFKYVKNKQEGKAYKKVSSNKTTWKPSGIIVPPIPVRRSNTNHRWPSVNPHKFNIRILRKLKNKERLRYRNEVLRPKWAKKKALAK